MRLVHGLINRVEDHHIVTRAIAGVDVNVNDVFIAAVQALGEDILQIHRRNLVLRSAVVNTLRIGILTGQQRIGNGIRAIGNGGLGKAQPEAYLMPQSVADLARRAKEGIHLGILLIGIQVVGFPVQNKIPVQIHIVFVIAAVIFHTIGVDIGNHQDSGGVPIQIGINFSEEHIQHGCADIPLHTVHTGGQYYQIGIFSGTGQVIAVDVQSLGFIHSVAVILRIQLCHQLIQMLPDRIVV